MHLRFSTIIGLVGTMVSSLVMAGPEPELGAVAKHQALLDVGTDLRLMCVAAHPDDEDGATLTYYRKKFGYKTFAVIATRGEGGQNEIGPELYEELGVIRTHEMMRASEHTGADLHFLNYPEFGFSKSAEETFDVWGKEETVRRMVAKIRELKPDVIITHHDHTSGHGHHRAVSIALSEAFDLAGDPKAFPEQFKRGLKPWQAARLYWRDFTEEAPDTAFVPFSELDSVRGLSYAELAANALREHKSQGMEYFIDNFIMNREGAHYTLVKHSETGVQGGKELYAPSAHTGLFKGMKDRVNERQREIAQGLVDRVALWEKTNSEIRYSVNVSDKVLTPGQTITIDLEVNDFGQKDLDNVRFKLNGIGPFFRYSALSQFDIGKKGNNGKFSHQYTVKIPEEAKITLPHADHLFDPYFLIPQLTPLVAIAPDKDSSPVIRREMSLYVDIAPPVGIEYLGEPYLVQQGSKEAVVSLAMTNYTPEANEVEIRFVSPKGIKLPNTKLNMAFAGEDEEKVISIPVKINSDLKAGDYSLTAAIPENDYGATGTIRVVDYAVPDNINVGVIKSYDDTFLTTLDRMGVPYESLEKDDFSASKLDEFSTIIVDIRAYLVRKDLVANNQAILDYVKRGGTVLVMYQKTFEWKEEFAPYPLTLSRNRVTREDAPITVLKPRHPLFTTPNVMVDSDWDGWRQERGLYFPSKWDRAYTPLIDVQDPGESNPPGSLLVADYGEGMYVYTALGWYRQLRELHPGTVRMFANMLAL